MVGTVVENRRRIDLQPVVGLFVNTLPLRNYPGANKTFKDFLKEVKDRISAALDNQEYPFEQLIQKVSQNNTTISTSLGNPFFDVFFEFITYDYEIQENFVREDQSDYSFNIKNRATKFDFILSAMKQNGQITFSLGYNTHLFDEKTIIQYLIFFKRIILQILHTPEIRLENLELIGEEEKKNLFNLMQDKQDRTFIKDIITTKENSGIKEEEKREAEFDF